MVLLPTLILESVVLCSREVLRSAVLLPTAITEMIDVLSRVSRLDDPTCDSGKDPEPKTPEDPPLVELLIEI